MPNRPRSQALFAGSGGGISADGGFAISQMNLPGMGQAQTGEPTWVWPMSGTLRCFQSLV